MPNLNSCTQHLQEKQKRLIKEIEKKRGNLKKPQRLGFKKFDKLIKAPFSEKLEYTENLIKESLEKYKKPCVACSFGKDSTLVLYLIRQYNPDIPVLFNNTGVEYPETLQFRDFLVKEWDLNFHETNPAMKNRKRMTFWRCVKEYGLPRIKWARGRRGIKEPRCCYYLKERPAFLFYREHDINTMFSGLSYDESYGRRWLFIWYGDLYKVKTNGKMKGITKIHPLAYWDTKEVWQFIKDHNIPVNKIYEKVDRCGCMTCTAFLGWEKQLRKTNPKLYQYIKKIAIKEAIERYREEGQVILGATS